MFVVVSCRVRQGKPFWTCSGIVVARVCLKGCLQFSSCHEWKGARGWATVVSPELCRSRLDIDARRRTTGSRVERGCCFPFPAETPGTASSSPTTRDMATDHLIATNKKPIAVAGEKRRKITERRTTIICNCCEMLGVVRVILRM